MTNKKIKTDLNKKVLSIRETIRLRELQGEVMNYTQEKPQCVTCGADIDHDDEQRCSYCAGTDQRRIV